jgi:hypothetical protein
MAFDVKTVDSNSVDGQWGNPGTTGSLLEALELDNNLEQHDLVDPEKDANVLVENEKVEGSESLLEETVTTTEDKTTPVVKTLDTTFLTALEELAKDNIIDLYEDYEIKTLDDVKLLIEDNIKSKLEGVNQNIFEERLQSLPPQFQSIVKYGLNGGSDVQSLLQSWANVENVYTTDISTDAGREQVVREYLQLTNYGTIETINEDIQTWKDLGKLESRANAYKPKLEEYHMQTVAAKEQEALQFQQQKEQYFTEYTNAVGKVLSQETVNGLPLDKTVRQYIFDNSQPIYQSIITGEPIDALQAAVENLKFGQNADPAFYSEALLFLTQPEVYKEYLVTQLKTDLAQTKERTLRKKVQADVTGNNLENVPQARTNNKKDNLRW